MSAKFHITPNGPRPCQAREGRCPLGGEHFKSQQDAEKAYGQVMGGTFGGSPQFNRIHVIAAVTPQAGGRYMGCKIPKDSLHQALTMWRSHLGEKAHEMEQNKAQRDRGYIYHMTVVSPQEIKNYDELTPPPSTVDVEYLGVGSAKDGGSEAWFLVCRSPQIAEWREANGLPPKDMHITLGFSAKDVHTQPKDESSIVMG